MTHYYTLVKLIDRPVGETPRPMSAQGSTPPTPPAPDEEARLRGRGRPRVAAAPEDQRARILDAAARAFARHGFAGASLRQIAQEAGLSHAMIRHLFGGKDALWEAAAEHLFAALQAGMAATQAGGAASDPVGRMEAQVRASVRAAARTPALAGFVMQAGLAGGPRYAALVERYLRPLHAFALEPFRQLAATGQALDAPAHFVFLVATNAAINPFAQAANTQALAGLDLSDPAVAEAYADTLVAILKHGAVRALRQDEHP